MTDDIPLKSLLRLSQSCFTRSSHKTNRTLVSGFTRISLVPKLTVCEQPSYRSPVRALHRTRIFRAWLRAGAQEIHPQEGQPRLQVGNLVFF
jgi:hypothetical protein